MDDFFEEYQPKLVEALTAGYGAALDLLTGQQVYAVALAHADLDAWRPDLNTEEMLAETGDPTDEDSRWWPDEWGMLDARDDVNAALKPIDEVCGEIWSRFEDADLDEEQTEVWYARLEDVLFEAVSDPRVRQIFTDHGQDPVLVVNNTDGDNAPTAERFDQLNSGHSRNELLASARAYWMECLD